MSDAPDLPPASAPVDDAEPKTPASPLPPGLVRKIAENYDRPKLQIPDAEPARPLHDLKEEYKNPWKEKKRWELRERVKKGDGGLDPHLRKPWERTSDEAGASPVDGHEGEHEDTDSGAEDDDEGDSFVQLQLPQQASLHLLRAQPTILPLHTTPFAYAVDPWLQDNPEYKHYLDPSTPSSPSSPSSLSALPNARFGKGSVQANEVSARTKQIFLDDYFKSVADYLSDKKKLQKCLEIQHVRTLLMRSAVLVRSAWTLEQTEWRSSASARRRSTDLSADAESGRMGQVWYKTYSKAGRAAENAEQMARALGMDGLQARAWYWKGQADAGRRSWDEAGAAFWRAEQFDSERVVVKKLEEYGKIGLTPFERRDVGWLREMCNEKEKQAQQQSEQRAWPGKDADGQKPEASKDELEEDLIDLNTLRAVVGGEIKDGKLVHAVSEQPAKLKKEEMLKAISVAREKNKTRNFRKFSEEELRYIVDGIPIPEEKQTHNMESEGFLDNLRGWQGGRISVSSSEADDVSFEHDS